MDYLVLRDGRWYYRRRVPKAAQAALGRTMIEEALKTSDKKEARKRARLRDAYWQDRFDSAESAPALSLYEERLRDFGISIGALTPARLTLLIEALKAEIPHVEELDAAHDAHVEAARRIVEAANGDLPEKEIQARYETGALQHRADLVQSQKTRPIGSMVPNGVIQPDAVLAALTEERLVPPPSPTSFTGMREALTIYLAERPTISPKTAAEWTRTVDLFIECHGGDIELPKLSTRDIGTFKQFLLSRPSGRGGKIGTGTVNKRIHGLSAILKSAVANGLIGQNPASGTTIHQAKRERPRLPLTGEDIRAVQIDPSDELYWVWTLGIYTGARLHEIVQLRKSDVRQGTGAVFLSIRSGDGRSIKTASSERLIPLHKDVGGRFLAWVTEQPSEELWPQFWQDGEVRSDPASKALNRLMDRSGIADRRKTFHSLRHSFKDLCRSSIRDEEIRDYLTGHATQSVGRLYGVGFPQSKLSAAVNSIKFRRFLSGGL